MNDEDKLKAEIMRALEVDWQWQKVFEASDLLGIAQARSVGRKAGRALKKEVRTHQSHPQLRSDGRISVVVMLREVPEADEERFRERMALVAEQMSRLATGQGVDR